MASTAYRTFWHLRNTNLPAKWAVKSNRAQVALSCLSERDTGVALADVPTSQRLRN